MAQKNESDRIASKITIIISLVLSLSEGNNGKLEAENVSKVKLNSPKRACSIKKQFILTISG
jgi:hypothetical protein